MVVAYSFLYCLLLREVKAIEKRESALLARETGESALAEFRKHIHWFFIVAIVCSLMSLLDSMIMSAADYKRALTSQPVGGRLYNSSIGLALIGNAVMRVLIIFLLAKNDENAIEQEQHSATDEEEATHIPSQASTIEEREKPVADEPKETISSASLNDSSREP